MTANCVAASSGLADVAVISGSSAPSLLTRYQRVRELSAALSSPLSAEDQQVQSMPDVSPTKWHLAHTSWFFETFLLSELPGHRPYDASYALLFNSYYNTVGEQFSRPQRGLLSRPSLEQVWGYRQQVDEQVSALLSGAKLSARQRDVIELGLQHEQQHQELMLTDIKHVLSVNPGYPRYAEPHQALTQPDSNAGALVTATWHGYDGGLLDIGYGGRDFCFDNERPSHRSYLPPFLLASRLVTVGNWREFSEDGGYRRPELWLSEGWDWICRERVSAPLYWHLRDDWEVFTLHGSRPLQHDEPVCHVSYFEADAYARWAGARLPREEELEVVARSQPLDGHFVDSGALHPRPARHRPKGLQALSGDAPAQLFGDCWEWTQSSYSPYPGYHAPEGALGEYNGKFMCNQQVLRGGSCVTSRSHMRHTYRNFFPATARWQFSGVRLARDV